MSDACDRCGGAVVPGSAICRRCLDASHLGNTRHEVTIVCRGRDCHRLHREVVVTKMVEVDVPTLLTEVASRIGWQVVHTQGRVEYACSVRCVMTPREKN